ncbi:restriction endonuclease subunit S [Kocuria sp. CPCC 204721]|uniref:restriction endonuclease subunit S n=1 Tax=Kocuria sp. CPCC 204721 TaxID=3073548 RepID=UPI0034D65E78
MKHPMTSARFPTVRFASAAQRVVPVEGPSRFTVALESIVSGTGQLVDEPWVDSSGPGNLYMPGDILYGKLRPYLAKVWVADRSGNYVGDFVRITPRSSFNNQFLKYVILTPYFTSKASAESVGSKMPRTEWDSLKRIKVPAPRITEQRHIADYLDHETAEIDAFIADQSQFIDLVEERESVLIETTITGRQAGVTPRKNSGSDWVGDIPNHWEMERISWLFSNVGSGTTPASDDVDSFNGTIPWVTSSELRETGVSVTNKLVSDEAVNKYSALRVHPAGSLMIAMYGATIGRLGWLEVPATVNQAICVFSDYRKGPSKYPFFALLAARRHLLTLASGGGQPNINQDKLRSLRIPIPPEHEQTDIVRSLDKSLRDATQLAREAKILIDLARERRAALITAAVTGQIDVTAKNKPAAEQIEDDVAQGLHREYA